MATYENANGMANMYYTDHVAHDIVERGKYLALARDSLLVAEKYLPGDWSNTCDLGSVELRLAVLARDREQPDVEVKSHFSAGREQCLRVVNELRPGYGFALYELGILHRVWEKWDDGADHLQRALEGPRDYRDVSDGQVKEQQSRIAARDRLYP